MAKQELVKWKLAKQELVKYELGKKEHLVKWELEKKHRTGQMGAAKNSNWSNASLKERKKEKKKELVEI